MGSKRKICIHTVIKWGVVKRTSGYSIGSPPFCRLCEEKLGTGIFSEQQNQANKKRSKS